MATIFVDYEGMSKKASKIRAYGQEMNELLISVYRSVAELRSVWTGRRYNSVVNKINSLNETLNSIMKLVVNKIPNNLEKMAKNYATAENQGSRVTTPSNTSPRVIPQINLHSDSRLKCLTEQVTPIQKEISENLKKVCSKMENIEATYNAILWESKAATTFNSAFTKIKNDIITSLKDIDSQIQKLIVQAQEDIEISERKNFI